MNGLLRELNRDLWYPFSRAYDTLDADDFLALNSPDLMRASGSTGSVHGYAEYAEQIRDFFAMVARNGDSIGIEFRFTERLMSADLASERGVFRISVVPAEGQPRTRYGRFHTYARKADGRWLFAADYDSPDGATEEAYAAAHAVDDLAAFAS